MSCTATVADTDPGSASAPTGEVTFEQGSCTLEGSGVAASCSVSYTASSPGTRRVRGDLRGVRILRAAVLDERGRTVRRARFKRGSVVLDLRGLTAGTYTLRVTVRLRSGKRMTAQRTYRTCKE